MPSGQGVWINGRFSPVRTLSELGQGRKILIMNMIGLT